MAEPNSNTSPMTVESSPLDEFSARQMASFFNAIAPWRNAYQFPWFTYIAKRDGDVLKIVTARLYLDLLPSKDLKEVFVSHDLQAGQFVLDQSLTSIEEIICKLMSQSGLSVPGHGNLLLPSDQQYCPTLSTPMLLHPEGLREGNRLAVLIASSVNFFGLISQPETDWQLKAAERPYDSFNELRSEYALGTANQDRAVLEIVAPRAVEVSARSNVVGTTATIGVWTTDSIDSTKIRLNYRVLDKEKVTARGSALGADLTWEGGESGSRHGLANITVPRGAVVQCIACYGGHAHHQRWFIDPEMLQNPRHALLSIVDPGLRLIRQYLLPEFPVKGRAADDFEAAVTWMLWALGFAPINFGLHPKTTDAFDVIAVSPLGHCLVVECTLGLLKADSKLSKLGARAAQVRRALDAAEMQHLKVVPVMVTAKTRDEVSGDLTAAKELGAVVLTREDLEASFTEILKFPDGEFLMNRVIQSVEKR